MKRPVCCLWLILSAALLWPDFLGSRRVPGPLPPDLYGPRPAVDIYIDLVYSPESRRTRLDLAVPVGVDGTVPVVVYVHGGGFCRGGKESGSFFNSFEAKLLLQLGVALAAVNYRLTDETGFPGQIEDVKTAVRFLKKYGGSYGLAAPHIALLGHSAGANLVLMAALTGEEAFPGSQHRDFSSEVGVAVSLAAPTDFSSLDRSAYRHYVSPTDIEAASPVNYPNRRPTPLLVVHGSHDDIVPLRQAEYFVHRQLHRGCRALSYVRVQGGNHGFSSDRQDPGRRALAYLVVQTIIKYIDRAGTYGDINLDGALDILDIEALKGRMGARGIYENGQSADLDWNPLADLDDDLTIDEEDLKLIKGVIRYPDAFYRGKIPPPRPGPG
jgi:acetyl esterase/lipase